MSNNIIVFETFNKTKRLSLTKIVLNLFFKKIIIKFDTISNNYIFASVLLIKQPAFLKLKIKNL